MSDPGAVARAAETIRRLAPSHVPVAAGVVLGSGLAAVVNALAQRRDLAQSEVPGFPVARVAGHAATLVFGRLGNVSTLVCGGRCHLYEGHDLDAVTFPVRLMHALGARTLVLTAAVGGIRDDLAPGTLVTVDDHLNLLGAAPMPAADGAPVFLDLGACYDASLRQGAAAAARTAGVELASGVLAAVRGPQFETPAEVRMLRSLGADMVCMSLVPEAIAGRQLGMRVLGLVVVANRAAGLAPGPITHEDVLRIMESRAASVARVVAGLYS